MKKTPILALVILLTASGMASAGDLKTDAGNKDSKTYCVGSVGLLSRWLGISCGPESGGGITPSTENLSESLDAEISDSQKSSLRTHAPRKTQLPPQGS